MAFKIKESDRRDIAAALETVAERRAKAEDAVRQFNTDLAWALARLMETIEPYNEALQTVRGKLEDVHRELDEEFGNKSEKWQTSDKASEVAEWMEKIEELTNDIDDVVLDVPELDADSILGVDFTDRFNALEPEP